MVVNMNMRGETEGNINQYLADTIGCHILTDDKAPVELLGMQVIDQLIQDELAYYKSIFQTNGIKGLMNEL